MPARYLLTEGWNAGAVTPVGAVHGRQDFTHVSVTVSLPWNICAHLYATSLRSQCLISILRGYSR